MVYRDPLEEYGRLPNRPCAIKLNCALEGGLATDVYGILFQQHESLCFFKVSALQAVEVDSCGKVVS